MVIVAPSSNGQVSKNGDACCKLAMNTGGQSIIAWRPSGHGGTVASGTDGALAVIRALKAENAALAHYLLVKSHSPMRPEASRCAPQKNPLTRREHEVLELVANGKRTKEIAAVLGIAFKTAACHRGRILNKLGVHSTTELIEAAVKVALVNL
jgi:DNA-binding NarL/FixJ family response regulator